MAISYRFPSLLIVLNVLYLDLEVESFDTTSLVSRIRGLDIYVKIL